MVGLACFTILGMGILVYYISHRTTNDSRTKLLNSLEVNRIWLREYFDIHGEYPILDDGNVNFWDFDRSEFVWKLKLHTVPNVGSSVSGMEFKRKFGWKIPGSSPLSLKSPTVSDFEMFFNPITRRFDWLAEDASGTLYSPDMLDSFLIASPPIRVVNIRCSLTASDPPFFEDFSKW